MRPQNTNVPSQPYIRPTAPMQFSRRPVVPDFSEHPPVPQPLAEHVEVVPYEQQLEITDDMAAAIPAEPTLSAPQSFEPRPIQPPEIPAPVEQALTAVPKRPMSRLAIGMSAAASLGVVLAVSGLFMLTHNTGPVKPAVVRLPGKVIAIANPELVGQQLQTSCYTLNLPSQAKIISNNGCSSQIATPGASKTTNVVAISAGSADMSVPLEDAPLFFSKQLRLGDAANKLHDVVVSNIQVGGITAIKMTYQLNNRPTQALVYATNLPAQYNQADRKIGSFGVGGLYNDDQSRAAFDEIVASLQWAK